MKLQELLKNKIIQTNLNHWDNFNDDPVINGVTDDSREVKKGDLFLAVPGQKVDGRNFINEVMERGAAAIIYEAPESAHELAKGTWQQNHLFTNKNSKIPLISCQNLANLRGDIAAEFYHHPSTKMQVVGVTGTNGKTSCTHFIAQMLAEAHQQCAILGTIGNGFLTKLTESSLTTPSAINLQAQLADFLAAGANFTAMEVSSHSLDQHRVQGVHFQIAVLTQLSRDHLDYHGSMENYAAAKAKLFAFKDLHAAVLNFDDELGKKLIKQYEKNLEIVAYSANGQKHPHLPSVCAKRIKIAETGFQLEITTPWGKGQCLIPLMGKFNINNVLAVISVLGTLGIPFNSIMTALTKLQPVRGRMQQYGGGDQPCIIVDYAHTPDALEKALLSLKEHQPRQLWCIFGCGGNRDSGKRAIMAEVAEKYANRVVVTNDNPRGEDPEKILKDICKGFNNLSAVTIELDRALAINDAIQQAHCGDIILVAGKGHEAVQIIGDQHLQFSDQEQVIRALKNKK